MEFKIGEVRFGNAQKAYKVKLGKKIAFVVLTNKTAVMPNRWLVYYHQPHLDRIWHRNENSQESALALAKELILDDIEKTERISEERGLAKAN